MFVLNNDELAEAIAFAHDNSKNGINIHHTPSAEASRILLEHLKKLLEVQLNRAKYESCVNVPRQ